MYATILYQSLHWIPNVFDFTQDFEAAKKFVQNSGKFDDDDEDVDTINWEDCVSSSTGVGRVGQFYFLFFGNSFMLSRTFTLYRFKTYMVKPNLLRLWPYLFTEYSKSARYKPGPAPGSGSGSNKPQAALPPQRPTNRPTSEQEV